MSDYYSEDKENFLWKLKYKKWLAQYAVEKVDSRNKKKDVFDSNWTDCLYCNCYGFIDETMTEDECRDYLVFENHKKKILNELNGLADVQTIYTDVLGKDIYIKAVPYSRGTWVSLIKSMLKFAHYNDNISVVPKQAFYYTDEGNHFVYWELFITTNSLSDLEGLIELLIMYNSTLL